jgi:hypothetical protein
VISGWPTHLFQALVGSLDGEYGTIDDGLVALLVEAEGGDLGQQVVKPGARSGVAMGARHGDVAGAVDGIVVPEVRKSLKDAIAHGRVAGLDVQNNVDNAVGGVGNVADDEGAAVEALAQAGTLLGEVSIASEADLDDGASDIGFANTDQVLVPRGRWTAVNQMLCLGLGLELEMVSGRRKESLLGEKGMSMAGLLGLTCKRN